MQSGVARVYVNAVEVGSLPTDQYRRIVNETKKDRRIYFRQAVNISFSALRFLIYSFRNIPFAWFMFFVVVVLADSISPGFGTDFLHAIMAITKVELNASLDAFRIALFWGFAFTTFSFLLGVASGALDFGAVNEFDLAVNQKIREILEVPTEGPVTVLIEENSNLIQQ